MRKIDTAKKFRSEYKRVKKQYKNISKFDEIAHYLKNEEQLPRKFNDHSLKGEYKDCRECHIKSDLVLIYEIIDKKNKIILKRIGSHSSLGIMKGKKKR